MPKQKILLISPPINIGKLSHGIHNNPPIGLLYIAAMLEKHGLDVSIIDFLPYAFSLAEIMSKMEEVPTPLIGISATTAQIKSAVQIARNIKERFPKVMICIGGVHVTNDQDFIDRYPDFDCAVVGDGEYAFLEIAQQTLAGNPPTGVKLGKTVTELDLLPLPSYHHVDFARYREIGGMDSMPILGTKGCPFNCVFCSRTPFNRTPYFRNPVAIVDEMEKHYHYFNGRFVFLDDSFTLRRDLVQKFCQEIIRRKLKVNWHANGVRADQIDALTLDLMRDSGCRGFYMGIESGDERVRNELIHKNLTDAAIFNTLKLLNQYNFDVELSFILGVPGESLPEMEKTIRFPQRLIKAGIKSFSKVSFKPIIPMPGSKIFDIGIKEGGLDKNIIDKCINGDYGDEFWKDWPKYVPRGITFEQIKMLRKKGFMFYYLSPYFLKQRIIENIRNPERFLKDFMEFINVLRFGRSRTSFSS